MKAGKSFDDSFWSGLSPLRRTFFDAAVELGELRATTSILNRVIQVIFAITPADRAAVYIDSTHWECERGETEARLGAPNETAEKVFATGEGICSYDSPGSIVCLPLVSRGAVIGALYLESIDADNPLTQTHAFLMAGAAPIAANAFNNSLYIERLETENARLKEALDSSRDMVGGGAAIKLVKEQIAKVAPTDASVLIQGESGTGKEVVAQAIHRNSKRKDGPFVAVNCGAIAESLRESELFGHEKGAFTGAAAQRKGKIELANGGTLFLDEVAELTMPAQASLLRVLQERKFERLGGMRTIPADVRIIAATNSDLETAVKRGRFRRDLFFRLQVIAIKMPPLRDRAEDVIPLALHFIQKHRNIRYVSGITPDAQVLLAAYAWPGNVRELENTIMRALVLGGGESIRPEDLPEALTERQSMEPVHAGTYHEQVNAAKRSIIQAALRQTGANVYESARLLDLHPTYLYRLAGNLGVSTE
jgi:two-component system response regulator HydG